MKFTKTLATLAIASIWSVSLLAASSANAAGGTQWTVKPESSSAAFLATGKPGFLKIRGEGAKVEGKARVDGGALQGSFDVALGDFVTGIDLRDEHMREKYLETAKFPRAHLELDPVALDGAGVKDKEFTGKLTLKDVTKPVSGTISLAIAGEGATGSATFDIKLSDYPVGVPSHLGISVAESVEVKVEIVAAKSADVAVVK